MNEVTVRPFSQDVSFFQLFNLYVIMLLYQQILTAFVCVLCWFCVQGNYSEIFTRIRPSSFQTSKPSLNDYVGNFISHMYKQRFGCKFGSKTQVRRIKANFFPLPYEAIFLIQTIAINCQRLYFSKDKHSFTIVLKRYFAINERIFLLSCLIVRCY